MSVWPHSWVAYFAGCACDECKRFDALVFSARQQEAQERPTTAPQEVVRT